ncbi:hypothetical protein [Flavobacterium gyeonganense]|uniref:Glycosyl transferase family 2 n=1 Tax=Flavobacterium gyeonganense TaxID=1310418 RepID=A0ABV5H8I3_9FLAO|nr:hypothetical protein [Flavobacterium gyeonganense]
MIKVGYLVSYDYCFLLTSLKQLYNNVDRIYLAIDKDLKTWSGNDFELPQTFFDELKAFDSDNKIEYYFDSFYVPDFSPSMCETRERNMLAQRMGKGWLIQLDVDEYIYDFEKVSHYLKKYWYLNLLPKKTPIVFRGKLITLFKKLPDGFLYIENNEKFPFITNVPKYIGARFNNNVRNHFTNIAAIHQSWARSENEISFKIKNWGHKDAFDTKNFLALWDSLNSTNYKDFRNIHPLVPEVWNELQFLQSDSIEEFIDKYSKKNKQKLIYIEPKKILKALLNKVFK